MSDEPKEPQDASPEEQLEQLKAEDDTELSPQERFRKTTHIALLMAYDLIDKLRYLEKEVPELPEEQVKERQEYLVASIEQLRVAYLELADLDT